VDQSAAERPKGSQVYLMGQVNTMNSAFSGLLFGLLGAIVLVAASCYVCFNAATRIARLLGNTGNVVIERLLGVILAALAVQYVVDGVRTALAG